MSFFKIKGVDKLYLVGISKKDCCAYVFEPIEMRNFRPARVDVEKLACQYAAARFYNGYPKKTGTFSLLYFEGK